jgi:hypothetical protein
VKDQLVYGQQSELISKFRIFTLSVVGIRLNGSQRMVMYFLFLYKEYEV